MNEKNYGISAAEENDLREYEIQSEERYQYEKSEDYDQSIEHTRGSNYGTGVDRPEMSFDGKLYVHGQHCQLLIMKEKYDTSTEIDKYMSLAHDIMFT